MYKIVVGAAISRPRAIDNRPYILRIVAERPGVRPLQQDGTPYNK